MVPVLDERCGQRAVHAIRIGHSRALAGAVRVGLEDTDAFREHAIRSRRGLVVGDLRTLAVPHYPLVHEWKMTDGEAVLADSRPACLPRQRACHPHIVSR